MNRDNESPSETASAFSAAFLADWCVCEAGSGELLRHELLRAARDYEEAADRWLAKLDWPSLSRDQP